MSQTRRPKRLRELAIRFRGICGELGTRLLPGDAEDILAAAIEQLAVDLGVSARTAMDRYADDRFMRTLAETTAEANAIVVAAMESADDLALSPPHVGRVVAALGVCLKLAVEAAADDSSRTPALGIATDAADAVTALGAGLRVLDATDASDSIVTLDGRSVVYARRVITATVEHLQTGAWDCPGTAHARRHTHTERCPLQRDLIYDLSVIGGWPRQPDSDNPAR